MQILTKEEISNLDTNSLRSKLVEIKREVFSLKIKKVTSGLEKPHLVKVHKKNIARINFYLSKKA